MCFHLDRSTSQADPRTSSILYLAPMFDWVIHRQLQARGCPEHRPRTGVDAPCLEPSIIALSGD